MGKKQKEESFRDENYSQTARLGSIFLVSLTYAHKESHINTVDIVGVFIKAKILDDKDLVMKKNRELTKLFCV